MNRDRSAMQRLETTIGEVLRFGTITSSTMFAIGLVMTVVGYQPAVAQLLLATRSALKRPVQQAQRRLERIVRAETSEDIDEELRLLRAFEIEREARVRAAGKDDHGGAVGLGPGG